MTALQKALSKALAKNTKKRTINYHSLIHRLVANYFLPKPSPNKTIVAHVDFNKLNNSVNNLIWMTPEVNYAHQVNSPYVVAEINIHNHSLIIRQNDEIKQVFSYTITAIDW